MTIKELKLEYPYIIKYEGKFLVFDNNGKRSPYKYLASVIKKGRSLYVEGYKPTTKMDILKKQVSHYSNSLPYDSEYYNPMYIDGYKTEIIVHDYLDSIGFEHTPIGYQLKRKSIYGHKATNIILSFFGLDSFVKKDTVDVCLSTGDYSYISITCKRDETEIIKSIDSILKPLLLTESINNIETSKNMEVENVDIILNQLNNLDFKTQHINTYLKQELQKIINKLN